MTYDVIKKRQILETEAFYTAGIGQIQEIKWGSDFFWRRGGVAAHNLNPVLLQNCFQNAPQICVAAFWLEARMKVNILHTCTAYAWVKIFAVRTAFKRKHLQLT